MYCLAENACILSVAVLNSFINILFVGNSLLENLNLKLYSTSTVVLILLISKNVDLYEYKFRCL